MHNEAIRKGMHSISETWAQPIPDQQQTSISHYLIRRTWPLDSVSLKYRVSVCNTSKCLQVWESPCGKGRGGGGGGGAHPAQAPVAATSVAGSGSAGGGPAEAGR